MYIITLNNDIKRHVFVHERFVKITGRSISIKSYVQSYSCHVDWNSVVWDTSDRYIYDGGLRPRSPPPLKSGTSVLPIGRDN